MLHTSCGLTGNTVPNHCNICPDCLSHRPYLIPHSSPKSTLCSPNKTNSNSQNAQVLCLHRHVFHIPLICIPPGTSHRSSTVAPPSPVYGGLHNVPQDVHDLIPRTRDYITLHSKEDFSNVIKSRILRWRDYPGSSRWALNVITSVL